MIRLRGAWAAYQRNLLLLTRQHTLIAQTLVLPTAILLLVAFIFGGGGGDAWPVALVDDADSDESRELVEALDRAESQITPYFDLREMTLVEAQEEVRSGRLHLLVHIPDDFPERRTVETQTYNINTDAMKNARLRLDHAITQELPGGTDMHTDLVTAQDHDVWRSAYIGGSSVLLALLLGATLVAANLFAFEREHHTRTVAMLTPLGAAPAGTGIIGAAVTAALASSLLPLAVSVGLFNLEPSAARLGLLYAGLLPGLIGCAGLGILLGQALRTFRHVQPVIVAAALITFFATGGFTGAAMLHPTLQAFTDVWLPSRFFTWGNPVLHGFTGTFTAGQLTALWCAAIAGVVMTSYAYRRERHTAPQPPTI